MVSPPDIQHFICPAFLQKRRKAISYYVMLNNISTSTPFFSTAKQEMEDDNNTRSVIIGSTMLVTAILGCFAAVLFLGKDFFSGKFPSAVLVGALTWVDFLGAVSSSAFIFHGFVRGEGWLAGYPQCSLQAFFSTTFGLSSGAVVASMAVERTLSLSTPYFYRKHVTTGGARVTCLMIIVSCAVVSALPFVGIGRYMFNERSKSFCHFDWFSSILADRVFVFICGFMGVGIILVMLMSNVIVFVIVVRMKRKLVKVLPRDANKPEQRREYAGQEQRMAKFVALVSCSFLVTWLPVTVRLFCNVLGVFQSDSMDSVSLRLVIMNFILDPFSYVLLRKSFKRNVLRSVRRIVASVRHASITGPIRQTLSVADSDMKSSGVFLVTVREKSRVSRQ